MITHTYQAVTITRVAKGHYTITSLKGKVSTFTKLRHAQNFIHRNWYSILTD